jgi:hypothetical protein
VIDDKEHSKALKYFQGGMRNLKSNKIPSIVVTLQKLIDLQDRFKKAKNVKTKI